MTTSSPILAKRIYSEAKAKGIAALDAPVSGGDIGARNGQVVIMVGGDRDAFNALKPVFELMGRTIRYFGEAGAGQSTKMVNQIAIASGMIGVAEAVAFAKKAGWTSPRSSRQSPAARRPPGRCRISRRAWPAATPRRAFSSSTSSRT